MKTEKCTACDGEITPTMCQQGQSIQGVWHPFHVGCADTWMGQEIPVVTIQPDDDQGWTDDWESLPGYLASLEVGEAVTIEKRMMKRGEFLALEEI